MMNTNTIEVLLDAYQKAHADRARATFVLRNSENKWLIAHEHSSVPFHMDGSLRAAIDLAPPGDFYDRT